MFVSCLVDRLLRRQGKKMRCLGKLFDSKGREEAKGLGQKSSGKGCKRVIWQEKVFVRSLEKTIFLSSVSRPFNLG